MTGWIRLDADIMDNPKIMALSNGALRFYLSLACYCAQHETDGRVTTSVSRLRRIVTPEVTPEVTQLSRNTVARWCTKLEQLGLIIREGAEYVLPGYLERNPSREQEERERARWRARQRDKRERDDVTGGQPEMSRPLRNVTSSSISNNAHHGVPEPVDNLDLGHVRERLSEDELAAARAVLRERRR